MRYFIQLAFDGTNYSGWQHQNNAPSVQQTINEALFKLLGHKIKSMGCGRTDSGVHAKEFFMHFDAETEINDIDDFFFRLNCILPHDIAIQRIFPVAEKANTRYDALERTYEYFIHFDKSPFIRRFSNYQGFYRINWEKVLEATNFLNGIEDFSALCLPSVDFKTNICHITRVDWGVLPNHHFVHKPYDVSLPAEALSAARIPAQGELFRFTISSNRFLRGMVRRIVGTALMVGKGKISLEEYKEVVASKGSFRVHYLAPPNGLFLVKIKYPFVP